MQNVPIKIVIGAAIFFYATVIMRLSAKDVRPNVTTYKIQIIKNLFCLDDMQWLKI